MIDAFSFLYRNYYALPKLTTTTGIEVGALYGFTRLIIKIIKLSNYVITFYDSKKSVRKEISSLYKSNRKKIDDELIKQIDYSKELLKALGVKYFEVEGYEADDLIASAIKKYNDFFQKLIIVSNDKDLMQLISEKVFIWDGKSDNYFDENYVLSKYGVKPSQIKDLLILCGDSSDNIEGINGIGLKTASKILSKYQSIDNILTLKNVDDKYIRTIIQNRDKIIQTEKLVKLIDEIDIPYSISDIEVKYSLDDLEYVLKKFEFRSIPLELGIVKEEQKEIKEVSYEDFLKLNPTHISVFDDFIFYFDTCTKLNNGREILFNKNIKKYFYNSKEIFLKLSSDDLDNFDDIMIAYYLVWGALRKPDPFRIFEEKYFYKPKNPAIFFKEIMDDLILKIKEYSMEDLYINEMEISKVIYGMESFGIKVDYEYIVNLRNEFNKKVSCVYSDFVKESGVNINLNSPKQVSDFLFNKLNLKFDPRYESMFKTKTGNYSTSEEVLKFLKPYYPKIISLILSYREYSKLLSFTENLIKQIKGNRIYSHFEQIGTVTGRISSYDPNLQNIPIRTEDGVKIRNSFIADEGFLLVSFDYSQIDLRVIAHLSEDEKLKYAFENDMDVHRTTASSLFGVSYEDVDEEMRRIAKTINFGIIYGLSPFGLSTELMIDLDIASDYIKRYFENYCGVKKWIDETIDFATKNGYVVNFFGRRRYIPDINSKNNFLKTQSQRIAVNMPVQSGSSDIIKKSMVEIYRRFKNEKKVKLLLQIHDELVFEIEENSLDFFVKEIKYIMENIVQLKVPLKVNVSFAKRWGELK